MGFLAGWIATGRPVSQEVLVAASRVRRRLLHRDLAGSSRADARATGEAVLLGTDVAVAEAGDNGLTLAFEGRLDDRGALEACLLNEGHALQGKGDAALLLTGWRAWGAGLLPRLRGAFALVVRDAAAGTVTCARDGFGQRPLFWSAAGGAFVFASEIQALLAWPGQGRTADLDVIGYIMSFGHAPLDRTALRGVHSVAPGHALTLHRDGRIETTRWWRLPDRLEDPMPAAGAASEYRRRLRSAMARAAGGDGAAEVIGYGEAAAALVHAGGQAPQPALAEVADLPALLSRLQLHAGQPLLNPATTLASLAPMIGAASRPVSDAGADMLLLSHCRYQEFAEELARMRDDGRPPPWWVRSFHEAPPFARDLFQRATGCLTEAERMELSGPGLAHTLVFAMPDGLGLSLEKAELDICMDEASRIDLVHRLPGLELPLLDAAAAAAGKMIACPFLDNEVVELCLSLPQAMRREVLDGTGTRSDTAEPVSPAEAWLPGDAIALRPWLADLLLGTACAHRGLFARRRVETLVARCGNGSPREARELWAMAGIEAWFQSFVDRVPAEPDLPAEAMGPGHSDSLLVAIA
ncbi:asparagine synthase-related protein [Roseomonas xinghualingensis]|uniref:asparagine synthase-related protein n=1 Tax=Roseomonas xinghualingensis TaxID=2986475 RepID=UPI0021F0B374|nr:asparagine synthetase B [Roseomonas sp. SXEYE001]MCV4210201.1 asparagine synthetase B [Roseomonas sp. SXEYE001]